MNPKAWIPNGITIGNLTCGVAGTIAAVLGRPDWTILLILIAAFLDFFDGFFARLLKVDSPLGGQLDSLADVVTFGVAPGVAAIGTIAFSLPMQPHVAVHWLDFSLPHLIAKTCGVIYFGCAAYRLAKFNVDVDSSTDFKGLASPAAGIAIGAMVSLVDPRSMFFYKQVANLITTPVILGILTCSIGILMTLNTPMFSLKFKSFGWAGNRLKYIFLIACIGMLIATILMDHVMLAFPAIISVYVGLSLLGLFKSQKVTKSTPD